MSHPTEIWRPIPGYEGLYEVSSVGRVKALQRTRSNGRVFRERVLMPSPSRDGYISAEFMKDGKRCRLAVHRAVALAFLGPGGNGLVVRHLDGNPSNNVATNLAWGTASENMSDQVKHGTHSMASKTRCSRGHLLRSPNLVVSRRGARVCLACTRARTYAWTRGEKVTQDLADLHYSAILGGISMPTRTVKSVCPNGHTLDLPNLVPSRLFEGSRVCLACARGRATAQYRDLDKHVAADMHYAKIMSS